MGQTLYRSMLPEASGYGKFSIAYMSLEGVIVHGLVDFLQDERGAEFLPKEATKASGC